MVSDLHKDSSKDRMETIKCMSGQLLLSQVRKFSRTQLLLVVIRCFSNAGFDTGTEVKYPFVGNNIFAGRNKLLKIFFNHMSNSLNNLTRVINLYER